VQWRRSKIRWRWIVSLLLLPFVVAAAVLIAAVVTTDPNNYKPQITDAVERATGRGVVLNGPVRVGRSLWPTIELDDVSLANLPGGTRPDMVHAEHVEARLSLPALLNRRIDLSRLTLIGPNILLELVDGEPNWVFDHGNPDGTMPAMEVRIADARVRDGMVTIRLPTRTHVVGIRTLGFRRPVEGGPLELSAELVYQDNQPFRLHAAATPTGGIFDPWDARVTIAAFDATVSTAGRMTLAGPYDLELQATAPALQHLNALWPAMRLPDLRDMTLATHVTSGPLTNDIPTIGTTWLRFHSADLTDRLPGLTLADTEITLPQPDGTANAAGSGSYAGHGFSYTASFGIPARLNGAATSRMTLRGKATPQAGAKPGNADGSMTLDGTLALRDATYAGLDAKISLSVPALNDWQLQLPALTDVTLTGQIALPQDLATARLHGGTLRSRQIETGGDITLGLRTRMLLNGTLDVARLDLDALLAGDGGSVPSKRAARVADPVIPDTTVPWPWVRGKTIDLAAHVAALTLHGQTWRDVDLALQVARDRLRLARLRLGLTGDAAELTVSGDAATRDLPVRVTLRVPAVPLATVTQTLRLPGEATGALRLDAQLEGRGDSLRDLIASLNGSVSASMLGGSLSNAALTEIAFPALKALNIAVPATGRTDITCLGLSATFTSGVATVRSMVLDSTYLQLAGTGRVDLGREIVALALRPLAQVGGSPVEIPVRVEGPFRAMTGELDADVFDKLGLFHTSVFGGDNQTICADAGLIPAPNVAR